MARYRLITLLLLSLGAVTPVPSWAQGTGIQGPAHPRRIRSFIGVFQERLAPLETRLVKMALGDALYLAGGTTDGGMRYRLEIEAGVAAEFDMAVSSFDFIAADFLVGVPFTMRRGALEASLRLYHQSSHLGDDVLARDDLALDSLGAFDFEALELFLGRRAGTIQPYAGFEYRFRRTPDAQDPSIVHLGVGVQGRGRTRFVGGLHAWLADNGGDGVGAQARVGIEVRRTGPDQDERRPVRIFLEGLWGQPDAGGFYRFRRQTFGLTVELGR